MVFAWPCKSRANGYTCKSYASFILGQKICIRVCNICAIPIGMILAYMRRSWGKKMTHASIMPSPCEYGQKIDTCNIRAKSSAHARVVGKKMTCACIRFFQNDVFHVIGQCEADNTYPVSPESRMSTLSPIQSLLLARLAKKGDAAARALVSAGTYEVEPFTVTVWGGEVKVGEDKPYTPTTSVPLLATMVVALHRAGVQREGIAQAIIDAAKVASNNGGKVDEALADTFHYVEQEVKDLQSRMGEGLPKKIRAGGVRVKGCIR